MIIGYILAILEGILIVFIYRLGFNPNATGIYWIFSILATIFGVIMIGVGVHDIASLIKNKRNNKK